MRASKRVWSTRWFSGFATALVIVGAFAAAGLVLGAAPASEAATAAGPPGEIRMAIRDPSFPSEWFSLQSFTWGMSGASPPSRDRVSVQDVSVTKWIDDASPLLAQECCRGDSIRETKVQLCHGKCSDKSQIYLEYVFRDVIVTSYSTSGTGGDTLPTESVTLAFTEVEWTYQPQKDGSKTTGGLTCPGWSMECEKKH